MLRLQLSTENDAMRNEDGTLSRHLVAQQLRAVATQIEEHTGEGTILDENGNTIGYWAFS